MKYYPPTSYIYGDFEVEEIFSMENDLSSKKRLAAYYNALSESIKKAKGTNNRKQQQNISGNTRKEFQYIEELIKLIDDYRYDNKATKDEFLRKVDQLHSQTFQFSSRLEIYLRCKSYQYLNYPVTKAIRDEKLSSSKYYGIMSQFNELINEKSIPDSKLIPIQRHLNKCRKVAALVLLYSNCPFEDIAKHTGYSIPSIYRLKSQYRSTLEGATDTTIMNTLQTMVPSTQAIHDASGVQAYPYCTNASVQYTIKKCRNKTPKQK